MQGVSSSNARVVATCSGLGTTSRAGGRRGGVSVARDIRAGPWGSRHRCRHSRSWSWAARPAMRAPNVPWPTLQPAMGRSGVGSTIARDCPWHAH
jgi:hypothetical protein